MLRQIFEAYAIHIQPRFSWKNTAVKSEVVLEKENGL